MESPNNLELYPIPSMPEELEEDLPTEDMEEEEEAMEASEVSVQTEGEVKDPEEVLEVREVEEDSRQGFHHQGQLAEEDKLHTQTRQKILP